MHEPCTVMWSMETFKQGTVGLFEMLPCKATIPSEVMTVLLSIIQTPIVMMFLGQVKDGKKQMW